jgi:glucosylceramidase
MTTRFNKNASCLAKNSIIINRSQKFQSIVGFGNAFTGAVSHNLDLLPKDLQYKIYENYFSKEKGIALNMMRIPIGGCDFDLHPWAYNETPEKDLNLSNFTNLDQRDLRRIEQIRELEHFTNNHDIKFVGTAWSSPPWMKTNNDWTGYGFLKEEYYQTWAEYHVKYIELMEQQGMKYWAITTGNEPLNGNFFFFFVKFMSLGWSASSQGKWISENLGPLIKEKFPNLKILTGDDQRYVIPLWLNQMFESYPESRNYIDGIAVHWYWDSLISPKALQETHELIPDKLIIASEACEGDKPWHEHFPLLGDWNRAENYITDIIEDLNNFVNSWIDWNILLDLKGGPNYVNNTVDAAIVINETSNYELVYSFLIIFSDKNYICIVLGKVAMSFTNNLCSMLLGIFQGSFHQTQ